MKVHEPRSRGASVVFGGTGAIGGAVCTRLIAAGYHVHVAARTARNIVHGARFHSCDVTDSAQVRSVFAEVARNDGPISAVVHSAGTNSRSPLLELSDETWNKELMVNLTSAFYCIREAAAFLESGGSMVVVGSMMADRASRNPGYTAAKAGMVGLVKAAAAQLAEKGIRLNGVAPGYVASTMLDNHSNSGLATRISAEIVLGRTAHPREIADVIEFLLSEASKYIVGSMIPCNGGLIR